MKISIVIPNYNSKELLASNLPKIIEAVGEKEIIIVDDASTDGSVQEIEKQKSKLKNIKFIQNKKNLGFSSTVNKGVYAATGDLVVLLNTDVYPLKDFLKVALLHFRDPRVFAVGFLQQCPENGKIIERGRGVGKFQNGFLIHQKGKINKKNTLWVSGGAGIFRKSIWEKLGGLEELYNPFYWEDIDISYRALKAGYRLIFEPKSKVVHLQGKTIKNEYSSNWIKTIAYRNQILFVWLNITDTDLIFQHIWSFPFHLLKAFVRGDFLFFKAFFQAIFLFPLVLKKREKNRKLFKFPDKKILEEYIA